MAQRAQGARGNTLARAPHRSRSRKWVFTVNNPTAEDERQLLAALELRGAQYVWGHEIAPGTGTPHLQGFCEFRNPVDFASVTNFCPRAHWERGRGSTEQNYDYCSKDGDRVVTNIAGKYDTLLTEEYGEVVWKQWQQRILDLVEERPDPRKIHWYWEPDGNTGKSYLTKYLAIKGALLCEGKGADVKHLLAKALEAKKKIRTVIIDVPRTAQDFVSYATLEKVKNGCFHSGKYEGMQCIFPIPRVLVFSNKEPEYEKMSADRWDVTRI